MEMPLCTRRARPPQRCLELQPNSLSRTLGAASVNPRRLLSTRFAARINRTTRGLPSTSSTRPSLPEQGSLAEGNYRTGRTLQGLQPRTRKGDLPRPTLPPPSLSLSGPVLRRQASLVPRTWGNTLESRPGRASASVGSASVDEVVREPSQAPTDSRQPLLPTPNALGGLSDVIRIAVSQIQTLGLTFPYLVSRGRLKWADDWLAITSPGLPAGLAYLTRPLGAARLAGPTGGPHHGPLWTTKDANAHHHLLTADRYLTTQSFWALLLGPSSSSRNGCYGSDKGTEDTSS